MKFLQKRWVAIVLCVVMVVAAVAIGQVKDNQAHVPGSASAAASLGKENAAAYVKFLQDEADILSSSAEEKICAQNGALDASYGIICGVATVQSLQGQDIEDAAYDLFDELGLGVCDFLLVLDAETPDWYFMPGIDVESYVDSELKLSLRGAMGGDFAQDPDACVLQVMGELSDWCEDHLPGFGQAAKANGGLVAGGVTFFVVLLALLVALAVISALLRAGRRAVGGVGRWMPFFFFGGPRYRDPWRRNPPPPGPGPRPGPGSRPSGTGGSRSSGFGSSGSRGGFGGSSRNGSGRSGGSRSGGFGGTRR